MTLLTAGTVTVLLTGIVAVLVFGGIIWASMDYYRTVKRNEEKA